jgi:hypothetical protein
MTTLSKLVALAILVGGTALIPAASSAAAPTLCCAPQQIPIVTNTTQWTVTPPGGLAKAVSPLGIGWTALTGSVWIGPHVWSGTKGEPPGKYVYSYHFCLCPLPPGVEATFPATLTLAVKSDDGFTATLNHINIGAGNSVTVPTNISVPASDFKCDNVLAITVTNEKGPKGYSATGLDVAGSLSGYFPTPPPPPGASCPCSSRG